LTLWDLLATFASVAGLHDVVVDKRAAAVGLPAMDSISLWDHWLNPNTVPPPRNSIVVGTAPAGGGNSSAGVVQGLLQMRVAGLAAATGPILFKLLRNSIDQSGWTGPLYPNASTNWIGGDAVELCTLPANATFAGKRGCLFNLDVDPGEHIDLESMYPEVVSEMLEMMDAAERTVYLPNRGSDTGEACKKSAVYGGYFGPFLTEADFD
jgi:hypothetical protein